jgi:hypothetical protein
MGRSASEENELHIISTGISYVSGVVGGIATLTFMVEGFVGDVDAQNAAGQVLYGAAAVGIAARVGSMALPRIYDATVAFFTPQAGPER